MKKAKTVDDYIQAQTQHQDELRNLRKLAIGAGLVETIKWGAPCYTHKGKNVVGLAAFKSYIGLWFHQGALLADKNNKFINAQEGTTKALRQWRMQNHKDIKPRIVTAYIREAMALVDAGKSVPITRNKPLEIPAPLAQALKQDSKLKQAFEAFSLSKKREFTDHIAGAKQEATVQRRLEKILPMIKAGTGLNDKYR